MSIKNYSSPLCGTHCITLLLGDILLPKIFYNSTLLSRFFIIQLYCLGFLYFVQAENFLIYFQYLQSFCQECVSVVQLLSRVQLFATPWTVSTPVSSCLGNSPGENSGVGCHALLQGIFLTQRWNSCLLWLLYCRQILYF